VITDLRFFALAALVAWLGPFGFASVADAQQAASPRHIGVLVVSFSPDSREAQAFRQGLLDAGYSEGRNVVIEWRFANGNYDRVPAMAADLVQSKVDVIVADTTVAAQGAKRATSTIPIVMALVADPVSAGLVASLAHPGGNVTGLSMMIPELSTKRLQLIKEINPRLARAAVLWNRDSPFHPKVIEELKAASPVLGSN
jgi:putative ABC transport system substrate-binding protein